MQIKTTMETISHLSEWLSSINQQQQMLVKMWRKEMQTGAATVESRMEIPQKIKNGSAFWPSNPTSGNISKGSQNTDFKEHKHPCVHCSIIDNCQDTEAAQVPIKRWVDKTTMGHLHNEILLGCKKEENFTLCNSMDGPGEHYAKWNKPVRERQIPYNFNHVWNLMNNLN